MAKILGKYVVIDGKDFGKPRLELLRDLLFESTGIRIPLDKIRYGKPQKIDQRPEDKYDPNTFLPVLVDIEYDVRYRSIGDGFMYRRHSLNKYLSGIDFSDVAPPFFPFRTSDVLEQINAKLEYPLDMDDLVEMEYDDVLQFANGLLLRPRLDSYIWVDDAAVVIDTTRLTNSNVLTKKILDGFNIYQPPNGPFIINGFANHENGCADPLCPLCKDGGYITADTPAHVVAIVNFENRPLNASFRKTPQPEDVPLITDNALTLVIPPRCPDKATLPYAMGLVELGPEEPEDKPIPVIYDGAPNPYNPEIPTDEFGHPIDMSSHSTHLMKQDPGGDPELAAREQQYRNDGCGDFEPGGVPNSDYGSYNPAPSVTAGASYLNCGCD